MTKRVVGGSLFGLGLFLLMVAFALSFVIAPLITRIPYDLKPTEITTEAPDATFVQVKIAGQTRSIDVERAGLRARTGVQPDVGATAGLTGDIAGQTVIWNVFQKVERTDTGEVINASESRIALDRTSGAAANWGGQCLADEPFESCSAENVQYAGQLYQFPFGTEKKTYQYYDGDLGKTLPISYRGTDSIEGLSAYRFEQVIAEQPLKASAESMSALTERFAPGATTATMMYSNHRTVWVEPVTGVIVSVKEQSRRMLVPDVGQQTLLLDATFRYSPQTLRSITDSAASGRRSILTVRRYAPIGLATLGILGLVAGYRITRRAAPSPRGEQPALAPAAGERPAANVT